MGPTFAIMLVVFGIPLVICALIALFAALMLLLPDPIRQARANLEEQPWRSMFLGILNFIGAGLVFALLVTLMGNSTRLQSILVPLLFLIGMVVAVPTLIGLCAVIMLVGVRLGETSKPLFTYLRSGGLLLLACVVPFIGWFVFTPILLWASMGSVIGTLVRPKVPEAVKATEALHD
jgi:hypothetical protein